MTTERQADAVEGDLIARSKAMRNLLALAQRVAQSDAPVLLTGESGSGKERVARYIHASSRRVRGEFVAVHRAAPPAQLPASGVFGPVRGAFTRAGPRKKGPTPAAGRGAPLPPRPP